MNSSLIRSSSIRKKVLMKKSNFPFSALFASPSNKDQRMLWQEAESVLASKNFKMIAGHFIITLSSMFIFSIAEKNILKVVIDHLFSLIDRSCLIELFHPRSLQSGQSVSPQSFDEFSKSFRKSNVSSKEVGRRLGNFGA